MKSINKFFYVALLGVLIGFSSCQSLIPFTNVERTKYNLDEAKLRKMQFYISR